MFRNGLTYAIGRATQVPLRQVIGVQRSGRSLEISYIGRKKTADPMSLTKLVGTAEDAEDDIVDAWVTTLLHLAYEGMVNFQTGIYQLTNYQAWV
jgi:hypothetical protein